MKNTEQKLRAGLRKAVRLLQQTKYAEHHCQCSATGPVGGKGCVCVDELAPLKALLK